MIFTDDVISSLQSDNLAVIPTDTLYGIVCRAQSPTAVEKLYRVRGRNEKKPCIILLENISGLNDFGIVLSEIDREALLKVWPGKVSVVFDCPSLEWTYLHRDTKTLAFRVPDDEALRNLLHRTGPLLAPSANTEGQIPAHTIEEAKKFFAQNVDIYVDGGYKDSLPSTVARLQNGIWETLRKGIIVLEH